MQDTCNERCDTCTYMQRERYIYINQDIPAPMQQIFIPADVPVLMLPVVDMV